MPEVTKPRTVDVAADLLLSSERPDAGARLLGAAIAYPFPETASAVRPLELEEIRAKAIRTLGERVADRLFAEGAALDIDAALTEAKQLIDELIA